MLWGAGYDGGGDALSQEETGEAEEKEPCMRHGKGKEALVEHIFRGHGAVHVHRGAERGKASRVPPYQRRKDAVRGVRLHCAAAPGPAPGRRKGREICRTGGRGLKEKMPGLLSEKLRFGRRIYAGILLCQLSAVVWAAFGIFMDLEKIRHRLGCITRNQ